MEEFQREHYTAGAPVKLTGLADQWPAVHRGDREYLRASCGPESTVDLIKVWAGELEYFTPEQYTVAAAGHAAGPAGVDSVRWRSFWTTWTAPTQCERRDGPSEWLWLWSGDYLGV